MEKAWYVVHTYSGYENKVKTNLEKRVESMGMEDKIFRVLVPTEEEVETKDGKKRTVTKKVFPGYVLVEMVMTDDSWYVVRNTPGVTGFVGSTGAGSKPTALLPQEADGILRHMGIEAPKIKVNFALRDMVQVNDGPFSGRSGEIIEIQPDKQKVRVLLDIFGRETPVELDFTQIHKLD
ncbi:transcription termination/antitermination protein NusG [Brevibacillus massiliensis]|uniref:transcription termination/antitermination protein NusG n=1 Tax=Brevibacillus massiliensis TaxID=1118054 RepID=UPI00037AB59F|nr:transcription termination/antitermination protein NusG [Brevibacillus massiliensis]